MSRSFHIQIDFPALESFTAVINRWLDSVDGADQQAIDDATARIKAFSARLKNSIGDK